MSTTNHSDFHRPGRRRWLFRLAALMLGFSPLLASELGLRLANCGYLSDREDPFVGFSGIHPLFERNAKTGRYEIAKSRQTFFRPDSFAIHKGRHEFRIFCLGGSTVQGRPFAIETSFTRWLKLSLQAADPSRQWEVVNCGGVSYASYRLAPIMQECLNYQPDLFILYTGQNEFLEDRTYQSVKQAPRWIIVTHGWLTHLRTYNTLRSLWLRWKPGAADSRQAARPQLPDEVDALLDYQRGLDDYHRDDAWRRGTIEHFEFNLRRMVHKAQRIGVPVILVNPVANLKDSPPFKSAHRDDLSDEDRARFHRLWDQAKRPDVSVERQMALLRQAIAIDARHAGVLYHLAKCYEGRRRFSEAKRLFIRAKDEDICPLRILEPMRGAIVRVAGDTPATLVDAERLFEQLTPHGIPGREWLIDHVHPTIRGHQRLAAKLLQEMVRRGLVHPRPDWERRRDRMYHDHFASLEPIYFVRGQQRLEGLRRWTQGRASLIKQRTAPAAVDKHDKP